MVLESPIRNICLGFAVIACAGFILNITSPFAFADAFYSTSGYSEVRSNWNSSINIEVDQTSGSTLTWAYHTNDGLFSAFANAQSGPGQMKLSGYFQESYSVGTNVALIDGNGNFMWLNVPLSVQAITQDRIQVNGPVSSYDLTFPVSLDGSFFRGGTANCIDPENPLGLEGQFRIYSLIRSKDGKYRQAQSFSISEDQFVPGVYDLTFQGIPTGKELSFYFQSWAGFYLTDTYDYTDQLHSNLGIGWMTDPRLITVSDSKSQRIGDSYNLWGFADFSHTVSFGSFVALNDGVVQTDVTINSLNNDGTFAPVPEPTSLLLLGTGLGVIGLAAWRRRK
jgi:hypothetical protein